MARIRSHLTIVVEDIVCAVASYGVHTSPLPRKGSVSGCFLLAQVARGTDEMAAETANTRVEDTGRLLTEG